MAQDTVLIISKTPEVHESGKSTICLYSVKMSHFSIWMTLFQNDECSRALRGREQYIEVNLLLVSCLLAALIGGVR